MARAALEVVGARIEVELPSGDAEVDVAVGASAGLLSGVDADLNGLDLGHLKILPRAAAAPPPYSLTVENWTAQTRGFFRDIAPLAWSRSLGTSLRPLPAGQRPSPRDPTTTWRAGNANKVLALPLELCLPKLVSSPGPGGLDRRTSGFQPESWPQGQCNQSTPLSAVPGPRCSARAFGSPPGLPRPYLSERRAPPGRNARHLRASERQNQASLNLLERIRPASLEAQTRLQSGFRLALRGAGGGDRTRITSLEGWGSTIELRPRAAKPSGQERTAPTRERPHVTRADTVGQAPSPVRVIPWSGSSWRATAKASSPSSAAPTATRPSPSRLTEVGRKQARQLGRELAGEAIDLCVDLGVPARSRDRRPRARGPRRAAARARRAERHPLRRVRGAPADRVPRLGARSRARGRLPRRRRQPRADGGPLRHAPTDRCSSGRRRPCSSSRTGCRCATCSTPSRAAIRPRRSPRCPTPSRSA